MILASFVDGFLDSQNPSFSHFFYCIIFCNLRSSTRKIPLKSILPLSPVKWIYLSSTETSVSSTTPPSSSKSYATRKSHPSSSSPHNRSSPKIMPTSLTIAYNLWFRRWISCTRRWSHSEGGCTIFMGIVWRSLRGSTRRRRLGRYFITLITRLSRNAGIQRSPSGRLRRE